MQNKKFKKWYSAIAVAAMTAMIAAPFNVFAAPGDPQEVNSIDPSADNKADDPTKLTGIDPTAEDDPTTDSDYEGYVDTDIDVWGYTEDATVYSVDVEWGAMTFQYEKSKWNPETHMKETGAGWKIYDTTQQKVLDAAQDAINKVTVINHSNAPVYAKMSYNGETGYTDTTGEFTFDNTDTTNNVKATWNNDNKYFSLQTATTTADGSEITDGSAGAPAKGNVYFMPSGIGTDQTINKWTKIGKITVALSTTEPTATPAP